MKKLLALAFVAVMCAGCFKVNTPLSINPSSVTLKVGDTYSVSISSDGDAKAVTDLQTENSSIASVHGTIITGVSVGNTRVYVEQYDSADEATRKVIATAYCSVTVTAE